MFSLSFCYTGMLKAPPPPPVMQSRTFTSRRGMMSGNVHARYLCQREEARKKKGKKSTDEPHSPEGARFSYYLTFL